MSGETAIEAAKRELSEEMGITPPEESFIPVRLMRRKNSILSIFLVPYDVAVSSLVLQTSEVSDARWVHRNKLRQMIRTGEFHNYGKEYFDAVFGAFDKRSASKRRKRRHEQRRKK